MNDYMLILYDNPAAMAAISPAQMQAVIERYTAWASGLAERGQHIGGNKLKDESGRVLERDPQGGGISASDGPFAEAKEVIGGYFLIRAATLVEAERIARDCPHLDYGGRIEIRAVDAVAESDG